jgi:hypothetical protein
MVLGVLGDGESAAAMRGAGFPKLLAELPEDLPVESPGFAADKKPAITQNARTAK